MLQNAIRAARLDTDFYNTVEHDTSYTGQAAAIVVIVGLASGFGAWFGPAENLIGAVVGGVVFGIVGWLVWSGLTLFVGVRVFDGTADYGEMLRVLGFAQAPLVLAIIPFFGWVFAIWAFVAGVVAIREGLDFSTGKAIGTAAVGWIILVALNFVLWLL